MDLYLQLGYGMMEHCRHLFQQWGGGTVILSPRDLDDAQLYTFSKSVRKIGGLVLLDSQFYLPHADHERLRSHAYWPEDYESGAFWTQNGIARLLENVVALNRQLGCVQIILPGLLASNVSDEWLERQQTIINSARSIVAPDIQLLATVALSEDALRDTDQVHLVLDAADHWQIHGVYLVGEHPRGDYHVNDPNWLANILDLTAGFRLKGKSAILGYCHHQLLIAGCAAATAIAAGTWMNVRSFPPEKFRLQYDDERRTRTTWYYCPQTLSEFTIPFLDLAKRQGVLHLMMPPSTYGSHYADSLFTGVQPSSAGFTEQEAFRHYLQCLHEQVLNARMPTLDATFDKHSNALDEAASLLDQLHMVGVRGQARDFVQIVDVNRAALEVLKTERAPMLRRHWSRL